MREENIIRALRHLRAQIIRERQDGLEHVEALLVMRGDNLPPVPRKHRRPFKKGAVKRTILAMLREGPTTTEAVAKPLMTLGDVRWRTARATAHRGLHVLKRKGAVEGGASGWRLSAAL